MKRKDVKQNKMDDLNGSLKWSLVVHVIVALLMIFGLPSSVRQVEVMPEIVIDMVGLAEETTAKNTTQKIKEPEPKQPEPKKVEKPTPKPEPKPEPVKKPEPKPKAAPKSTPPKQTVAPPSRKPTPPKEKVEVKEDVVPTPKPEKKEEKKKEEEKPAVQPNQEEFQSVLKNLLDTPAPEPEPKSQEVKTADAPLDETQKTSKAPIQAEAITASEIDALRYQLARCWNIPIGARDAQDLVIEIEAEIGQDAIVKKAIIVDQKRYRSDEFFRAAADSARRALFARECTPLALPENKYKLWNKMIIQFNPRDMFGG